MAKRRRLVWACVSSPALQQWWQLAGVLLVRARTVPCTGAGGGRVGGRLWLLHGGQRQAGLQLA